MDEIEIVVKMPKNTYRQIQALVRNSYFEHDICGNSMRRIANGTPLPKGHGRIGDLDKLIQTMKARNDDNGGEPLNAVDRGYDLAYQHMVKEAKECIIIKADKE